MLININEIKVNPGRREAAPEDVQSLHTSGAGLGGLAALLQSARPIPKQDETMSEEAFDTAMDFINGL